MPYQELQARLHRLSWQGEYWGPDGAIAVSKKLHKLNEALGGHHALSGLSSTYYSAAANAAARARKSGRIKEVIWFIRAYLALRTAG
ncbi:hypothetical protein KW782_02920 [Candidatus Parcubacteria bacterium]|nr:hypothetical protein [Candidatus Parcubacteria bacterium]